MKNHISHIITLSIQKQTFSVFKLSGEESLSQPFHFEIVLILPIMSNLAFNLNTHVTLSITDQNNHERNVCGVITKIQHLGLFDTEQISLIIHLQPLLARLQIAKSLQFFQNMTVLEITRKILQNIGYHNNQLTFYCNKTYVSQTYINQVTNETDLAFLHRLLAYAGIFYWCTSNKNREIICFSDNNQACPQFIQKEVFFVPPNGLNLFDNSDLWYGYFYHMQVHTQLITTSFSLSGFNPDISIEGLENTQSYSSGFNYPIVQQLISHVANTPAELTQETSLRLQRAMIDHWQLYMQGNILLSPGQILNLNAFHFQKTAQYNNSYLVIKLKHFAQQPSDKYHLGKVINYYNDITLIKAEILYCDALPDLPKSPACWMGHVESDSHYPLLDKNGNYRLQIHYDISERSNINSNRVINRICNYGNAQHNLSIGKHLPLANGTEVILSCFSGNFNQPVIIGTLPNFIFRSPVTSSNKTQNKLLTQQNNLLLLDDKKDCQKIQLSTEDLQNKIELNNYTDTSAINIQTEQGLINLKAYKNITIQSNSSLLEQCGNNWLHYAQQNYSVQTQNQSMCYKSAEDLQFTAYQNMLLSAHNNLSINSAEDAIIQSEYNMRFNLQGEHNQFVSKQGKIIFKCTKSISLIGVDTGEIKLSNNGNGISISSDGTITCYGNIIEIQTLNGVYFSTPPTN